MFYSHSEEDSCVLLTQWRIQLFYSNSEEDSCILLTVKTAVFYSHSEEYSCVLLTQWRRQLTSTHTGKKTAVFYLHSEKDSCVIITQERRQLYVIITQRRRQPCFTPCSTHTHTHKTWQQCSCLHTTGPRQVHSDPTPPFKSSLCQTSQITGVLYQAMLHTMVSMVRGNATWPGYIHYIRWHTELQGITGTLVNPSTKLLWCGMPPSLQHHSNTWLFHLEVMKTVDWLLILWIACCFLVCFSIPVCSSSDTKAKHCIWMYVLQTLMCS